jgi:hypothetical protein
MTAKLLLPHAGLGGGTALVGDGRIRRRGRVDLALAFKLSTCLPHRNMLLAPPAVDLEGRFNVLVTIQSRGRWMVANTIQHDIAQEVAPHQDAVI